MSKGKAGARRPLKWLLLGPLLIFALVQLYFLLMVCWYNFVNPRMTNMMSDQLAVLREKNPKAFRSVYGADVQEPDVYTVGADLLIAKSQ